MSEWTWEYEGYLPGEERLREALRTLGNGCFATRGAVPESRASLLYYPGTYAAGVYNRLESRPARTPFTSTRCHSRPCPSTASPCGTAATGASAFAAETERSRSRSRPPIRRSHRSAWWSPAAP
ncbi:hypothetical protein GCM10010478_08190 [Streptomyces erythrogriseus]|uniref:Glycoside hydrolase family 65 N-terminal domain-containing protein n=1 Tax=Streptomyces erythrogriseus TaxID=284027 RepID=A0ABN3WD68_9ACTN